MTPLARRGAVALAVACGAAPTRALAHPAEFSQAELRVADRTVDVELRLATAEVAALVRIDRDASGAVTPSALRSAAPEIERATLGALRLDAGGGRCEIVDASAAPETADGLVVKGRYVCPRRIDRLAVTADFVPHLSLGHTLLARVSVDGREEQHAARAGAERFVVERARRWGFEAARFFALGVEHIWTGYDHVAFLLGLLLLGGALRELVAVVSSFTVAHSITLGLAATGSVAPPARLIEPLIAATVIAVAIENLWDVRKGAPSAAVARSRWPLAFLFGLVHGFGLAAALRVLALPRGALAASLLSFNVGVELGQLAIVAVAWPVLRWARRRPGFVPTGVRLASGAVGLLGLFWLVQRL